MSKRSIPKLSEMPSSYLMSGGEKSTAPASKNSPGERSIH